MKGKSRAIKSWVITRENFRSNSWHSVFLGLLPSRFKPKRVADVLLALHALFAKDLSGKHFFARCGTKHREQSLIMSFDRLSIHDNPSTQAVLARDVTVQWGEDAFDQTISWIEPEICQFYRDQPPTTHRNELFRRCNIKFAPATANANELMVWGFAHLAQTFEESLL